jgi:hypothetical protein
MMSEVCTDEMICAAQYCEYVEVRPVRKTPAWKQMSWLALAIGKYAIEVIRCNNAPEADFSSGGTRVVFRPGRIDIV